MRQPDRARLSPLTLEDRLVPSGPEVRSFDGSNNNLLHPSWGQAGTDLLRLAPAAYADGVSTPAGADRPSARAFNPGVSNEFATAAFRFGHSLLGDDIGFLNNDGTDAQPEVSLAAAFFNPGLVKANGIDPLLKYLASDPSSEVDTKVVDNVRNLLLTSPGGSVTLDLASLNIQRGRDHGLADYNTVRAAFGLPRVTSFAQITRDPTMQAKLRQLYGSVDKIDLWVGALAEDHVPGGSVGPTIRAIVLDQFNRLRAGDHFWYERTFSGADLQTLRQTHLADVIARNTRLTTVQANPFVFQAEVSGSVFGDGNRDGRRTPNETGLAGRRVQLVNLDDGSVVAERATDPRGRFRFTVADGLRTGRYTVRVVFAPGETRTTPVDPVLAVRGGDVTARVDIGVFRRGGPGMAFDFLGVDVDGPGGPRRPV
jgi:peroxidase